MARFSRSLIGGFGTLFLTAFFLITVEHQAALAQDFFVTGKSMASELIVNRTQTRILRADDKVDGNCNQRKFTNAKVVKQPETKINGASVPERKWQEYWSLDRCGTEIGYWVFFTEVGQGGAYFSILSSE
jgi:hypothetical protein